VNDRSFLLPAGLRSARVPLRAMAFEQLLTSLWQEDPARPGHGLLREGAGAAIATLVAEVSDGTSPHRDRIAWLLGMLADAADGEGRASARDAIAAALPVFLSALDAQVAARRAGASAVAAPLGGLLFLLAHFGEAAATIDARLTAALGRDAPAAQAVAAVFAAATTQPERSRFVLSYLGAEACHTSSDPRLPVFGHALACPACAARLAWREDAIACTRCGASFGWRGDIPDLVPEACGDPDQFPAALVKIYEDQTRPRFLQVMGGDWEGLLGPERERAYLERFLRPADGPVLDLACGAGSRTRFVAALAGAARVIGLDYSLPMLQACGQAVPGICLVRGSASQLPIADASLGAVNCSDALQALPYPARAIGEAARCLRPGGVLTAFTFREAGGAYGYFQHRFPASPRLLFTHAGIAAMTDAAGLELVDIGGPAHALFFTARKPSA
jgi:SAM-dependent methyltransferase